MNKRAVELLGVFGIVFAIIGSAFGISWKVNDVRTELEESLRSEIVAARDEMKVAIGAESKRLREDIERNHREIVTLRDRTWTLISEQSGKVSLDDVVSSVLARMDR